MPITYSLYADRRLLVTALAGRVGYDEFYATYKAIMADTTEWSEILEFSLIPSSVALDITPSDLRDLAERLSTALSERGSRMKTAFVVPSDTNYGLASVYRAQAAFNGVMDLNVLRDPQQAVEWLGIDSAMLTQILPPDFH